MSNPNRFAPLPRLTAALGAFLAAAALAILPVQAAQAAPVADALQERIEGTVGTTGGQVLPSGIYAKVCPAAGGTCIWGGAIQGGLPNAGTYSVVLPSAGDYTVCFEPGAFLDVIGSCWSDAGGDVVAVGVGEVVTGIDGLVTVAGHLKGYVWYLNPPDGVPYYAVGTLVVVYRYDDASDSYVYFDEQQVNGAPAAFEFYAVPPGRYALHFVATETTADFLLNSEYWEDARYWAERTDVVLAAGDTRLLDVTLEPRTLDVGRLSGNDRFDVAVEVSQALFPSPPAGGVPVVYVANGLNFPDALSAGPAASAAGGLVLLVEPDRIPSAVASELARLNPQRIVVAGGPASVSPAVYSALSGYVDSPADIVRMGGADRYQAGLNIVDDGFIDGTVDTAIIATGATFPDALSAGPAAASVGAPVILVDGHANGINAATAELITRLGIEHVYIAGGTGSVYPAVETALATLLGGASHVTRFAGQDRFEVAILINKEFFAESEWAFLSTGHKFPDALSGGPLAAAFGGPLYLSDTACIPVGAATGIIDLDVQGLILLGGPGSLTPAVENLTLC
jgi:putative cell wall-binding protein